MTLKKSILLVVFLMVIGYAIYYLMKDEEETLILKEDEDDVYSVWDKCYPVSDEPVYDQETIPWGMGISYSKATTGVYNERVDKVYDTAVMSLLKGIDVQPSLRTIAMYADRINAYKDSSMGAIDAWDVQVGEFLCQ